MSDLINKLSVILADTYALYLKTQNYHWHVKGPQFRSLHGLFESQYLALAEAVDEVAERILIKGHKAPATFKEFERLKTIKDGNSDISANDMVVELAQDHGALLKDLNIAMNMAQEKNDEGTVNLLANRIEAHEKARWMLAASRENP
ncbi:Dps family protein [Legionella londiniensis]|uniref:DNA-binding protein n=1 Tax=Legionella londiniensis TaxID=45068 RepID=A0A0W0VNZ7_9GAMM|nr:DNA starvation/stationary phase protection protein [Legionella londiniensis]KTD21857.1 DNA-binding protein [Legionella londiniensis]STX92660.1 DNA-binding protein [Legionella londiniensis]